MKDFNFPKSNLGNSIYSLEALRNSKGGIYNWSLKQSSILLACILPMHHGIEMKLRLENLRQKTLAQYRTQNP